MALVVAAIGCKTPAPFHQSTAKPQVSCAAGEVCIYAWPNEACHCQTVATARAVYALPLRGAQGAFCFHGTRDSDPTHTHAFRNTFFAVDLASPLDGPPSEVVAARAGVVIRVFNGCVDPRVSSGHRADKCGNGFGNWVALDHGDGEGSFYAHLASLAVVEGQRVQEGQPLGTEGITGAAGQRHVHFSVHRIDAPASSEGMSWPSIPYRLTFRPARSAPPVTISVDELSCPHEYSQPPIAWNPL
jgi:murein DD-endopeptidase MepM/ murein hydrolase activator NlpD